MFVICRLHSTDLYKRIRLHVAHRVDFDEVDLNGHIVGLMYSTFHKTPGRVWI